MTQSTRQVTRNKKVISVAELDQKEHPQKCYEELLGRKTPCPNCPLEKVWKNKKSCSFKCKPSPDLPDANITLSPNFDTQGNVFSITEIVEWEESEKKEKRNSFVDKFISNQILNKEQNQKVDYFNLMAHQIQQPIGIIRGYVDLFFQNPNEKDKKIVESELSRLSHLISQILKLSHVDSGLSNMKLEKIELIDFLQKFIDTYQKKARNNELVFSAPKSKTIVVNIDRYEFMDAIDALLANAVKYANPESKIDIKVIPKKESVEISAKNLCPPIPTEEKDKIFMPFFRGEADKSGSGLGLSIAQRITELHKGSLSFTSNKRSTEFRIKIPRILPNKS